MEGDLVSPKGTDDESPVGDDIGATKQELSLLGNADVESIILEPGQTLKGTGFQITQPQDIPYNDTRTMFRIGISLPTSMPPELRKAFNELYSTLPHVRLTARDINRWKMAWHVYGSHSQRKSGNAIHKVLLTRRCTDEPDWNRISEIPIILGLTAATFIYGGLHALAWSAHFDSATEKLLWRISSCIVMGGLPMILSSAAWRANIMIGRTWLACLCI